MICLVVAGSILGISLITGRMIVAAANRSWFPRLFTILGGVTRSSPSSADSTPRSDAPINAIALSVILSAFYILLGNFRALLTFNGLGEYTFFFLTVVGAIILRVREPRLHRPYKTWMVVPVVFSVVSGFVIVRGAVFAPVQALILLGLWTVAVVVYFVRVRAVTA